MKVAGFIANRVAFNPANGGTGKKSFSRFIIRLSIVATVISVMVMIVTLAFVNGFQASVSRKVFNFFGHIHIQETASDQSITTEPIPILKNDSLALEIRDMPGVTSIHPFATRFAILKTKESLENIALKGIDKNFDTANFKTFMQEGRMLSYNDTSYNYEIILSAHTANELKLKLNDRLFVYFWQSDGKLAERLLTIIGIYKTGIEDYDKHFAIGDLRLVQRLNRWKSNMIGGYEVFLNDYHNIDPTVDRINELDGMHPDVTLLGKIKDNPELESDSLIQTKLQSLNAASIRSIAPNIFDWLNMQDVTRWVLIVIMATVAIINLIICLIILVLERIRMIGVLKALGATDLTVQSIFLRHSLLITLTGIIIGTVLALGLLYLQEQTGFIRLSEEAYYLSKAAVKISPLEVVVVGVGTLIVCLLVLTIPSILVRKIQPVKAIHFR